MLAITWLRVEDNVKQGEMFDSELLLYVVIVTSVTIVI